MDNLFGKELWKIRGTSHKIIISENALKTIFSVPVKKVIDKNLLQVFCCCLFKGTLCLFF
jgi:hypothetical protein